MFHSLVVFVVLLFSNRCLVNKRTSLELLNDISGGGGGVELYSGVVTGQVRNLNANNSLLIIFLQKNLYLYY